MASHAWSRPPPCASARGRLNFCNGPFPRLRLSRLRAPRCHLWLADDERALLRPLRPAGLRQPLPADARPPGAADVGLAGRTVEAHVATHGWHCPGWHREVHPVRPGELAADHPVPLVLGGEPPPARPGVLCASCNARKGLSQRRRQGRSGRVTGAGPPRHRNVGVVTRLLRVLKNRRARRSRRR
jgi:hypothetical protein